MTDEQRDKLAKRIASWLPDIKTFDGKPIVFDWKADFERRVRNELAAALVAEGPGAAPLVGAANPIYWEGYNAALDEWELRAAAAPSLHKEGLPQATELLIRMFLWEGHGHNDALYGDDGEMQCGVCHCDFKRDDLHECVEKARVAALEVGLKKMSLHKEGAGGAPGWTGIEHFDCGCSVKREAITPCQRHLAFWKKHLPPAGRAEQATKEER